MRKVLIVGSAMVLLALPASVASAASKPTPNGAVGACNMGMSWHEDNTTGMGRAMSVDNENGNIGMWRALDVSGCL